MRKSKKLRVGLFGFGRTGAMVAQEMINAPDSELVWIVRKSNRHAGEYASRLQGYDYDEGLIHWVEDIDADFFMRYPVDVIIDFSASDTVNLYKHAANLGIRFLSAISNYAREDLAELKKMARKTAVLYSPNISIGVNLLLLTSVVVRSVIPQADVAIMEEHFSQKQDISGTALRIAKKLKVKPDESVKSIRVGGIVGKHEVLFGLPNQTLRLTHESINRGAFGRGALAGATWLMECERGFYTMEQLLATRFRDALSELK
ncbi:MAG: dihydrodipicolinate reductase C-terminal domain-containing protein [Kiritimatiellae bacterium]|nr:dihydrodipicolinate reductase C-terminal domain-containing protein [Kiritimatiellia bacterium]